MNARFVLKRLASTDEPQKKDALLACVFHFEGQKALHKFCPFKPRKGWCILGDILSVFMNIPKSKKLTSFLFLLLIVYVKDLNGKITVS